MVDIQDYLRERAAKGDIESTLFSTGAFLDLTIDKLPLVYDVAKEVVWYDAGNVNFSTTSTTSIGRAIAVALKKSEQTKNWNIFVHDAINTQQQLVALVKKHVPGVERV